jgi:hypothetical protein
MSRMELQHAFEQGAATTRFERAPLWQAYPQSAQSITHSLSADPVFDWGSLADIIANGDRSLIEVREDTPAGRFKVRRDLPTDLRPLVAELAGAHRWIMLREVDRWHQFAPLVSDIFAAIEPVVQLRTGPVLRPTAFLFVSSPGLVTPLHFDPEFNILFQIAGASGSPCCPRMPVCRRRRTTSGIIAAATICSNGRRIWRIRRCIATSCRVPRFMSRSRSRTRCG